MRIIGKTIPEVQKTLESGRGVPASKQGECRASLSALLYLGMLAHTGREQNDLFTIRFVESLGIEQVSGLVDLLEATSPQRAENTFGQYEFEAYRIGSKADLLSEDWMYFCDRFRRGVSRGKSSPAALAIVSVFCEMADNVVWHAQEMPDKSCRALAGYHVTDSSIAFSVIDDGQGFLRSLQRNPAWQSLRTDKEALDAVVSKQATSREGETTGGGFKQLFNGLLNLNGHVMLRTGEANFTLRSRGDRWQLVEHNAHRVKGSQVTLMVGRNGSAQEENV